MKRIILNFILLNIFVLSVYSQTVNPPIPIEIYLGNNRTLFHMGVKRNIYKKINFSNSTSATVDYKNTQAENEIVMNNTLAYQFHKNINIGAGIQYHYKRGFIPNISMGFVYLNPTIMILLLPSFQFLPNGDRNIETMSFIEFTPKLTEKLRLYTKAQAMYNQNIVNNKHDRSFAFFRLGLKINSISFGAACRYDYYGPNKIFKENYGGFIKFDI
ncbi:MAG: hypothetical protein M0O93_06655 [Bacteroidales bacterium]|nr:hypothetical protein [Bacteroidales bacterium]